ncbi:hypothetical protein D9O36_20970 [Zobellia amurskyensis]|uniref:Uncharacterized protein n=1 Tax=Zobellia amurskyensis TaxID=248905 RepID=A0A7X2ZXX1_9FLAO|nr:hypothetical protein [Zobellia amurskyensis]MUH38324.1 hypothetical protein [Zobellia amurskyensis]
MRHTLAHKTLLFFSLILLVISTQSCKFEAKNEFNLEQTRANERQEIKRLLAQAKSQIENEQLADAIKTLDSIINNYGTYDEVENAYVLKEDAQNIYTLKKILTLQNIDSLITFVTDYDNEIIKTRATSRLEEVLTTTMDPELLQHYLDSNRLPQFRPNAKKRQADLLEQKQDELYANALEQNNAAAWKAFVAMYPEHPQRKRIEDKVIGLEVDEIFNGTYGEIPTSNQMGSANYVNSDIEITNKTSYTLTLRYSGPENHRLIISPNAVQKVNLKSGDYRVTASVNASRVSNYAGRESLNGTYSSSYYISN